MLSIARHTDYAARLVLHLAAVDGDAQVSIREVAEARAMPLPFVRRLVGSLVKAGILKTVRGASGGLRLARPANEISLLDIVEAMEGRIALNRCTHGGKGCPLASRCPIQGVWCEADRALRESLAAARFDLLARNTPGHALAHRALHPAPARRRVACA
ncbi:HTH-type transcriptional regulator CymR [mine drainage metagenome]|uniref:HTH-type transcriptional regulator CymR n=1 Tax=mine drainage metagenome TaxID=410659 RepID=A0A1J5SQR1_9ZZZZ